MRKLGFLLISLVVSLSQAVDASATSWPELLARYCTDRGMLILKLQQREFAANWAPKIADPRIKVIPIVENGEEFVDIKVLADSFVQMLPEPAAPFSDPCCNSGLSNASKVRLGLYAKLLAMAEYLDAFASTFGYAEGQISLKVFEWLRDLGTQTMLFQANKHSAAPNMIRCP